jgi:hypothetical protein
VNRIGANRLSLLHYKTNLQRILCDVSVRFVNVFRRKSWLFRTLIAVAKSVQPFYHPLKHIISQSQFVATNSFKGLHTLALFSAFSPKHPSL